MKRLGIIKEMQEPKKIILSSYFKKEQGNLFKLTFYISKRNDNYNIINL